MRKGFRLIEWNFDNTKNYSHEGLFRTDHGLFLSEEQTTAFKKIEDYLWGLAPTVHYLGHDHDVYPTFEIKAECMSGDEDMSDAIERNTCRTEEQDALERNTCRTEEQDALFKRSGVFVTPCPVTAFLYELMRDHVVPGVVEDIIAHQQGKGPFSLTNGWLACHAQDVAKRLSVKEGK